MIGNYAESMDIPSLICETMTVRAQLLLHQGETELAGKLLQKAIAKAKRNGMILRLGSALTRYGEVMFLRGQQIAGRKLLESALDLAKTNEIQIEIKRIEMVIMDYPG